MSNLIARRQPRWLPDLSELFTDFPIWADRPLIVDTQLMRLEAGMQDRHYVVRAEIPVSIRSKASTSSCVIAS